jgi:hypothetical protein
MIKKVNFASFALGGKLCRVVNVTVTVEQAELTLRTTVTVMSLKINATPGLGVTGAAAGTRRASGNFSLSGSAAADKAGGPQASAAAAGLFGVDAILALQGEEDATTGRRRRQLRRANDILDVLDEVKVATLSGDMSLESLSRLQTRIAEQREGVDDERLQGLLNEVETRALVELAKRRMM